MAEGGAAKLPVASDETHKEPEECAICYTEFKDPRFLDCSHRFCLKCLQELKQAQSNKNIVCPICRRETVLFKDEVSMLPKEPKRKAVSSQEQHKEGGLKVMCQACDENNEAISRCMECDSFLCGACQNAHQRLGPLRNHKLVTLTVLGLKNTNQKYESKDKVPKCETHPDKDICLYCESCEILICNTCTTLEHKPSMHTHCSIDEAFSKCTQEINYQMSQTKQYIKEFNSTKPMIDYARQRLDKMLTKTKIQISLKAEREIDKIRHKEEQLKKDAHRIALETDKKLAYAPLPEQTVNKVNKLMTKANHYEIIGSKVKLLHDVREQVEVHKKLSISHKSSFLGLKESEVDGELGTLLQEEKWVCKEISILIKGVCRFVAVYSTREIIVASHYELIILDPEGQVLSNKNFMSKHAKKSGDQIDIQEPTALAVNKDDQLIILDAPAVKIFNREYQLLHQFTARKESGKPTCLAVDDSNLIAVGYMKMGLISIYKPDGSPTRTLTAPMIDHYLTISNQRFIYTNVPENVFTAISFNCKTLFINSMKGICPQMMFCDAEMCFDGAGVCCDAAGDIYVTHSNAIQHYRADGKYINEWSCKFGDISDVTCTPQGTLVAVSGSSVYIFKNI